MKYWNVADPPLGSYIHIIDYTGFEFRDDNQDIG